MRRIRLLPLVLIAVSALLAVKVLGFVMGVEPFAVGPQPAIASGGEAASNGETPAPPAAGADTSAVDRLTAPIDLADEYKKLKAEQDKAAAGQGGGHGEAASAGGKAPVDAAHGAAPAGGTPQGAPAATDGSHGAAPAAGGPAANATQAAPPAGASPANGATSAAGADPAAAPTEVKPADSGGHAPAADAQAKPAEGGHGAKAKTDVYTERPKEYSPPIGSSERAILEGLSARRDELDKRARDLDMRAKLLEAAEQRLNDRLKQLQSIESQLGVSAGGAPAGSASAPAATSASAPPASQTSASSPASSGAAAGTPAAAGAPPAMNEQLAALVALYEGMKPRAAATVFDKLDTGTLLELADHMNPRKLSPIIAAMDPDKASRITSLMIGAQQAQKRVVVQVEQVSPALGTVPANGGAAPVDASQLPQIMPAQPGQ